VPAEAPAEPRRRSAYLASSNQIQTAPLATTPPAMADFGDRTGPYPITAQGLWAAFLSLHSPLTVPCDPT
jgi:hypothetical protein